MTAGQWTLLLGGVGVFAAMSLWAIRDAFNRDFGSSNEKLAWIQLAVLVPFLGGLAYLLIGRKRGRKTS
jgi:hypothetical protein